MGGCKNLLLSLMLAMVLMGLISTSAAYDFYVGGKSGWVLNPSESYSSWAQKNRFQINDALVFKYKKGDDSVLVVTKQDYDSCNVGNPIEKLDGGDSVFKLDRSGPFFLHQWHCRELREGSEARRRSSRRSQEAEPIPFTIETPQQHLLFHLHPHHLLFHLHHRDPPTTSPVSSPPSSSPVSSPPSSSPVSSPSPSPTSHVPSPSSPSPSPSSPTPSSPSPSPSPSSSSPSPSTPEKSPSPSPSSSQSPSSQPPSSSGLPPSETGISPVASSPKSSSASVLTASGIALGMVGLVLGGVFL